MNCDEPHPVRLSGGDPSFQRSSSSAPDALTGLGYTTTNRVVSPAAQRRPAQIVLDNCALTDRARPGSAGQVFLERWILLGAGRHPSTGSHRGDLTQGTLRAERVCWHNAPHAHCADPEQSTTAQLPFILPGI
jgi:hypothetical protein